MKKHYHIIRWHEIFYSWPTFWPANYRYAPGYDKWCLRFLWHHLASASCEFYV